MRVLDLSSSQVLLDRVRQFQFPPLPAWWVLPPGAGCAPLRATHTFTRYFLAIRHVCLCIGGTIWRTTPISKHMLITGSPGPI